MGEPGVESRFMRQTALALLLLFGCSSGSDLKIAKPEISLLQLYAPTDLGFARGTGTMHAEFGVQITNKAMEPITLRRIELTSIGSGGYTVRREDRGFTTVIPSGATEAVRMVARVFFTTDVSGSPSKEPVLLRAIVYFDAPSGPFRQVVTRNVEQFSQGPR
jgi:hypothetical protein